MILGKSVSGENVVSDLAKMPHCLIAGCDRFRKIGLHQHPHHVDFDECPPDEIKLIMIDPKKVELTPYTQLPHLIAPVITEPHGAYAALNWMVKEMQSRYDILKHLGLRNITAFNARTPNPELESSLSVSVPERMPAIVGIIDEFADLMMASSSDLETPIARIAQMARAVGIHLVLATQRPSREVITGLIKANFPTRIAFKVASRVNSQIILDENGAESLLGNGDMLFLPPGTSHLLRAQGAYVSDEDINRVVRFICDQARRIISSPHLIRWRSSLAMSEEEDGPRDSLYDQAKAIVIETQSASTTYLQRKLKIGYARAASLMDELEMHGVISSQEGSKPRRVLIENNDESNSRT
jgi:DNA segregation ATPase FtsK/SpoIIIE, S-DNA-T family